MPYAPGAELVLSHALPYRHLGPVGSAHDFDTWAAARDLAVAGVEGMIAGTRADHPDLAIDVQVF